MKEGEEEVWESAIKIAWVSPEIRESERGTKNVWDFFQNFQWDKQKEYDGQEKETKKEWCEGEAFIWLNV